MILSQYDQPTYERMNIPENSYLAVTDGDRILFYAYYESPVRYGNTFTEAHIFSEQSELQSFIESKGGEFNDYWNEQEEENHLDVLINGPQEPVEDDIDN